MVQAMPDGSLQCSRTQTTLTMCYEEIIYTLIYIIKFIFKCYIIPISYLSYQTHNNNISKTIIFKAGQMVCVIFFARSRQFNIQQFRD